MFRDWVVIKPNKSKASTWFAHWISNDLELFNLTILLKVSFQFNVSHLVVQASNEHFVADRLVGFVIQFGKLFVMSTLIKHIFAL